MIKKLVTLFCISFLLTFSVSCDDSTEDPCGNGIIEDVEECDSNNFDGASCVSNGYYGGVLVCTSICTLSFNSCASEGMCGDGVVQGDFEECDGEYLGGDSCLTLGYEYGNLSCNDNCTYNIDSCGGAGYCGDDIIDVIEECEGEDLSGNTCVNLGYHGGTLACTDLCYFDMSDCESYGRCGDGELQSSSEECDSAFLNDKTCETEGFTSGNLTCDNTCFFDFSGCVN